MTTVLAATISYCTLYPVRAFQVLSAVYYIQYGTGQGSTPLTRTGTLYVLYQVYCTQRVPRHSLPGTVRYLPSEASSEATEYPFSMVVHSLQTVWRRFQTGSSY